VTGREWIDAYAAALGVDAPDDATFEALLDLAGTAAHSSERIAAPIACWLVGRSGLTVDAAAAIAAGIGGEPTGEPTNQARRPVAAQPHGSGAERATEPPESTGGE
jgi:hypothetical protein